MWEAIKEVWVDQLHKAKMAWKNCWYDFKDTMISAVYAVAGLIKAILESVVFLPLKTAIYETGAILIIGIIDLIKRI